MGGGVVGREGGRASGEVEAEWEVVLLARHPDCSPCLSSMLLGCSVALRAFYYA